MSHYVVVNYEITDPDKFEGYVDGVVPLLMKHNGEILVADFASQAVEGSPHPITIVLRFADEGAAMGWYNDPDYAPLKEQRWASTNSDMVSAAGFVQPGG